MKNWYKFENFVQIQRIYSAQYTTKTFPSISVIKNIISLFEKTGSVFKIVHKPEKKAKIRRRRENPHNRVSFTINPKYGISGPGIG